MQGFLFRNYWKKRLLTATAVIAVLSLLIAPMFTPANTGNTAEAAAAPVPINIVNYGGHSSTIDAAIIAADPKFLIDNFVGGYWGGPSPANFNAAGITTFNYITGGYEGTEYNSTEDALASNLARISAIAAGGSKGVFVDEVSASPNTTGLSYLQSIYNTAHGLGLLVAFNVGVDSWSDSLMPYCNYINGSEIWNNGALSASEQKWASRTWLLTQGVNDATTAATLTKDAWVKGILAEYACSSYNSLPSWLGSYVTQLGASAPAPTPVSATYTITASSGSHGSIAPTGTVKVNSGVSQTFTITPTAGYHVATLTVDGTVVTAVSSYTFSGVTANHTINAAFAATTTPSSTPTPTPITVTGNATGTVASTPVSTGAANEYALYLKITSTTVSGLAVGQTVWCAATTTDFPNLLTVGATLTGNLSNSLGWWAFKKASTSTTSTYTITASAGSNGSITPAGTVTVNSGASQTFTVTPAAGYHVAALTVDGTAVTVASSYTFSNVTANHTVNATFTVTSTSTSTTGNTAGTVASTPVSSGAANEYNLYIKITSTTASGLAAGQSVWCVATTTDFPNLLTVGATLTGSLSNSLGWWVLSKSN